MKIQLLILEGKAPAWLSTAREELQKKLNYFVPFEVKSLKSPSNDRERSELKRKQEGEILMKHFTDRDFVVLFDEQGQLSKNSEGFATQIIKVLNSGKTRIVFCIGGPYGFADEVKKRSQLQLSLSPLTMNHWVAQLMALEQLYRAFTIIKGVPYHNR